MVEMHINIHSGITVVSASVFVQKTMDKNRRRNTPKNLLWRCKMKKFILVSLLVLATFLVASCTNAAETTPTPWCCPTSTPVPANFTNPDIVVGDITVKFERVESCPPANSQNWQQLEGFEWDGVKFELASFADASNPDVYGIVTTKDVGEKKAMEFIPMHYTQMGVVSKKGQSNAEKICFDKKEHIFWSYYGPQ